MVECPVCGQRIAEHLINQHLDDGCKTHVVEASPSQLNGASRGNVSNFFQRPSTAAKGSTNSTQKDGKSEHPNTPAKAEQTANGEGRMTGANYNETSDLKRAHADDPIQDTTTSSQPLSKRTKPNAMEKAAPLADRMRPKTLDEVCGQELVGSSGVLRGLIEADRVPSMILWGGPGTGKTTIARLVAKTAGTRFVEINSTSSGVAECKKLFADARNELGLTGRKTIIFCDEIHRFSKSQQDVFLGPVEAGHITLIGATTENPSFKVVNALLSRCRTFTLARLTASDIVTILERAIEAEQAVRAPILDGEMLEYLAAFSDGDARTALNLLELALDLSKRPNITQDDLKRSLTHTLVYDRAGDHHYDNISALHKSIRGGSPDGALFYLARMLDSGEDALYIARRLVVVASEDVGLADNSMLTLATSTYAACEKVGLPEARINLAHCTVALCLAPKSTRAYRALGKAMRAVQEPGVITKGVPIHLRNAPTRLMKEAGYGAFYKYNPDFRDGRVKQEYLPDLLQGRTFLEENDLGDKVDSDLEDHA